MLKINHGESFDAIGMATDQVLDDLTLDEAEKIITSISTALDEFSSVDSKAFCSSQEVIFM